MTTKKQETGGPPRSPANTAGSARGYFPNWARPKGAQALTKAIRTGSFHFRELILRDNEIAESGIVGLVLQGFGERPGACGTLDLRGNESRLAVATRIRRKLEASVEVRETRGG